MWSIQCCGGLSRRRGRVALGSGPPVLRRRTICRVQSDRGLVGTLRAAIPTPIAHHRLRRRALDGEFYDVSWLVA